MSAIATAVIGSAVVGGIASSAAADKQADAAQAGIDAQTQSLAQAQGLLQPWTEVGYTGLRGQQALLGAYGKDAQAREIGLIMESPAYQTALKQGENSILQNASATGGLRGGNTQQALSQFAPTLLTQLINDRYAQYSGLANVGQNSAAGQATATQGTAGNISNLLQQQGAAQAGGYLSLGNTVSQGLGAISGIGSFGGGNTFSGLQAAFSQTGVGGSGFGTGMAYGAQDMGQFL